MRDLQVAITKAKEQFIKKEERNSGRELQLFADNEELRSQHWELQEMACQHMHMWKISEEQRAQISNSYQHLQVEAIVDMERQRDAWRKEADETIAQLTKHYEQTIALVTAKAKDNQATSSANNKKTPRQQGRNWKLTELKSTWPILE